MTTDDRLVSGASSEPSLNPNKSSGDIVESHKRFNAWFASNYCDADGKFAHLPSWLKADLRNAWDAAQSESAAEIERHRRENKQYLALLEQQAIQIADGRTIYDAANRRATAAESAVAAAWEEAEQVVRTMARNFKGQVYEAALSKAADNIHASAIRAASGGTKDA